MKAHILGFSWELSGEVADDVTPTVLFEHLAKLRNVEREFNGFDRLVYVGEADPYFTGLLLTSKTHKKFCELKRGGEKLKINVREAEKGASLIDFNFFLIHKETGRGLYQHYHNSCSVSVFSRFIRREFIKVQANKIAEEIKALGGNASDADQERIYEKYDADLQWHLLVRKEKFDELVKEMQKVSSFEFTFGTIAPEEERRFRPLQGVSRVIKHRVTFNRTVELQERKQAILNLIGLGDVADAAVEGVDQDGLEKTIALANNPDSFGSYDFDKIADDMDFEPETFQDSKFMQTLIGLAKENPDLLGKRAE